MTQQTRKAQNQQNKQNTQKMKKETPQVKEIVDKSLARIQELKGWQALKVPEDYSPENAIRSAMLIIEEAETKDNVPVIQACSQSSIMDALLNMVIQGLSPMKQQCDFIPYKGKLRLQREYAGTLALAKRFGGVVGEPIANVIYQDDTFKYKIDPETGKKELVEHTQELENIDINKIKGAYAFVFYKGSEKPHMEIMTYAQIKKSWEQGPMKGQGHAHKNFPDRMSRKTVLNRACSQFINSSNDAPITVDVESKDHQKEAAQEEIQNNQAGQKLTTGFESKQKELPEEQVKDKPETESDEKAEPAEQKEEAQPSQEKINEGNAEQAEAKDNEPQPGF